MPSSRSLSPRSLLGACLAVCVFFPLSSVAQADSRVCYDVQNNPDPAHKPCYAPGSKTVSHCCSTQDTCVGDTLCLSQFATLYIGSCTQKDWYEKGKTGNASGDCPKYAQFCRSKPEGGLDIGLCDFDGSWFFCCGALVGNEKCCATDKFTIGNTTDKSLLSQAGSLSSNLSSADPSNPASTGSSNTPGQTCNAGSGTCSKNTGSLIGLGVGLGVPLLILAGLLVWENRKRRNAQALIPPQSGGFNPNPTTMPPEYIKHPGGQSEIYAHEAEAVKPAGELHTPPVVHELR